METDISPLKLKMQRHMEDDGGGVAPGGGKLLGECGDIHRVGMKLLISDFSTLM